MGRKEAQALEGEAGAVFISIYGSKESPAVLSPLFSKVLTIRFDDIDAYQDDRILFDREKAQGIIDFIQETMDKKLYIHCTFGVSRSMAVAKFAAEIRKDNFPSRYSLYNKLVYSTLKTAYEGEKNWEDIFK